MATRRERVLLEVESNAAAVFMKDAAAARLLARSLADLDGSTARISTSTRTLTRGDSSFAEVERGASKATASIDKLSGRVRILADVLAMVGPGLAPIGAVAVPAITGLANQLGFAAGAAGTAVVAFQGVGDALKAMQKASLEPTAANLAEVRRQLEDLSPAAAEFVLNSRHLGDNLKAVRDAAASGLFPGVNESFDEFEAVLQRLEPLLFAVGDAVGDIVAGGADSLASPRWADFFDFLEREARPTLTDLATTAGDFAHGLTEMWEAFAPLNADFGSWLSDVASGFDEWATGLSQTEGFAAFIDYVRATGPQVAETFGSLAVALVQIGEAAAPLGGPVLAGLEAIADVVSAIADSDFGTPLIAGLAAMGAINQATTLWGKASQTSAGQFVAGQKQALGSLRTFASDFRTMSQEYRREATKTTQVTASLFSAAPFGGGTAYSSGKGGGAVGRSLSTLTSLLSGTTDAAQRTRANLAAVGKTSGAVAGLALVTSGVADGMGVASTASLSLMGAMVGGVPGAVAGGLIGATLDFKAAGDKASTALREFDNAIADSGGSFSGYLEQVRQAQAATDDFASTVSSPSFFGHMAKSLTPGGLKNNLDVLFGGFESSALGKMAAEADIANDRLGDLDLAARTLAKSMGIADSASGATFGQMDAALAAISPAMQALGYDVVDVMDAIAKGTWGEFTDEIGAWMAHADSGAGRMEALSAAIAGLDNELLSTADSASALQVALEGLLSPGMNLSAATDTWHAGLQHLKESLSDSTNALRGQTDGARENREAIRGQVTNLVALMSAQAEAGAGAGKLSRTMRDGAESIVAAGRAAGLSEKELRGYLKQLGLTPKMVRTIIEANTDDATGKMKAIQRLVDRYGMTKAQARALLDDLASGKIKSVQQLIDKYGVTKKQARALLRDEASGKLQQIIGLLNAADRDVESTIRINTIRTESYRSKLRAMDNSADGGTVPKTGLPYADRHPYLLADGEEVISNRHGQADRHRSLLKAINAGRLANGGTAGRIGGIGDDPAGVRANIDERMEMVRLRREVRELTKALNADGKNRLKGLARQEAILQRRAARRDLGRARNAPELREEERLKALEEKRLEGLRAQLELQRDATQSLADAAQEQQRAAQEQRDAIKAQYDNAKSGVMGNILSDDIFGGGTLASFDKALNKQAADASAFESTLSALIGMGLDGALLEEASSRGDLKFLQQLQGVGAGGIDHYERLFAQTNATAARTGDLVANDLYGKQLAASEAALAAQTAEAVKTNERLERIEHVLTLQGPEFGQQVGDVLDGKSSQAVRTVAATGRGKGRPRRGGGRL